MIQHIDWYKLTHIAAEAVAVCSVLHTVLPPWDWDPDFVKDGLADFPAIQAVFRMAFHNRYYKLLIYMVGYIALNGRSTLWKGAISIGKQLEKARVDAVADMTPQAQAVIPLKEGG